MSTKILIGLLGSMLLGIGTWWVNEVNTHMKITDELHYRSIYLHGDLPGAPVDPIKR